ncbi:hypothetical protein Pint_11424 [Pistacia integerrima]|uniref:Uncharacterized protein n=1 Tax=Pistacia integerrima TaxID=434235 RepID=A0ACC0XKW7_9ROSI|nr:hypothetical protein Pint_11424 [Pistacia integerrima]
MGIGLPRIMRKLKLRLRKLQKGKRCSLRILISYYYYFTCVVVLGIMCWIHIFRVGISFTSKSNPRDAAKNMESLCSC